MFSELEPSVLPVVETLVLNHDAVKVLVEANLVVPLDIEGKNIYCIKVLCEILYTVGRPVIR